MLFKLENRRPTAFFSRVLFRTGGVFSLRNLLGNVMCHPPRERIIAAFEAEHFNNGPAQFDRPLPYLGSLRLLRGERFGYARLVGHRHG